MSEDSHPHQPVLLKEVLSALQPETGKHYLDGTLGAGGHSEAILEASSPDGTLTGFDLDPEAIRIAGDRLSRFGDRVRIIQDSYVSVDKYVAENLNNEVLFDGMLLDLGVSSMQVDSAARGFSFLKEGPLDMRFSADQTLTAYQIINRYPEEEIARILWEFGEERNSRRMAAAIRKARETAPIETTTALAEIISKASPTRGQTRNHPATRSFQALRIAVNDELQNVRDGIIKMTLLLKPGGRLAVISFHSLEDRIVKNYFRLESTDCICPPSQMVCTCGHKASLKLVNRHPIMADETEVRENPRARSAKLRVAEKIELKHEN